VKDLCEGVDLSESSVSRLLGTLVELGYASRDAHTGRYAATMKLWQVGLHTVSRTDDLQSIAQPLLERLSHRTGESTALGVLDDGYSVYIAKADGHGAIKAVATLGARLPATATAFGKAILAWRPERIPEALARVKRFTPNTLVARMDIERDLEAARERGYALNRGELYPHVCAIGCPIFDARGCAIAGLALWGSDREILGPRMAALVREARTIAHEISSHFGFVGPGVAAKGETDALPGPRRATRARATTVRTRAALSRSKVRKRA
jgi:DNA-binding IclR family transcriptional regulator